KSLFECMEIYIKSLSRPPAGIAKLKLIIKLVTVLFVTTVLPVSAYTYGQTIKMRKNNINLVEVFKEIRKQTDYDFLYSDKMMKEAKPVNSDLRNASIEEALLKAFAGQPFIYTIRAKTIVIQESLAPALAASEIRQNIIR